MTETHPRLDADDEREMRADTFTDRKLAVWALLNEVDALRAESAATLERAIEAVKTCEYDQGEVHQADYVARMSAIDDCVRALEALKTETPK